MAWCCREVRTEGKGVKSKGRRGMKGRARGERRKELGQGERRDEGKGLQRRED